jgi:hypothetical protein
MNATGVCICGRMGVDQFQKMLPEKQKVVDYVLRICGKTLKMHHRKLFKKINGSALLGTHHE